MELPFVTVEQCEASIPGEARWLDDGHADAHSQALRAVAREMGLLLLQSQQFQQALELLAAARGVEVGRETSGQLLPRIPDLDETDLMLLRKANKVRNAIIHGSLTIGLLRNPDDTFVAIGVDLWTHRREMQIVEVAEAAADNWLEELGHSLEPHEVVSFEAWLRLLVGATRRAVELAGARDRDALRSEFEALHPLLREVDSP